MNDQLSEAGADQGEQNNNGSDLGWRAALPDDLKNHDFVKDYAKPGDAIQAFVDLKTETSKMLRIPDEKSTDEERSAFLNALGRPQTAEEYNLAKPEGLPEDVPYDENISETFKGIFHEIGLSNSQAETIWGKYHDFIKSGYETSKKAEQEALDGAINSLKDEWTGDKFKENTELAHRAFTGIFEDKTKQEEAKTFIEETKINGLSLGDHPMFLKIFQQIGSVISDDRLNSGRGDGIQSGLSEEEQAKKRFPNTKFK